MKFTLEGRVFSKRTASFENESQGGDAVAFRALGCAHIFQEAPFKMGNTDWVSVARI